MPLILTGTSSSTTLDSSAGLTFSDSSNQSAAASPFGLKNRIINGDMRIDQRNAGASVTPANGAVTYTVDRFAFYVNQASKLTVQQSTTAPTGFNNSLAITSSSSYSSGASDLFVMFQSIEGYNVADLGWGTANAKTVTVSFWVRSSLTGTFGGALSNSGNVRSYPFAFTISAANTWEQKSITVAGDTSGTWLTTNGTGLSVKFNCGSGTSALGTANAWATGDYSGVTGSVSLVGTNGATFYITGVQLERNTTATPFEWIPYGTELALCQRYYEVAKYSPSTYFAMSSVTPVGANNRFFWQYSVQKRADATVALGTGGWVNATPTIFGGSTNAEFYNGNYFYAVGTSGNVALTASSEL